MVNMLNIDEKKEKDRIRCREYYNKNKESISKQKKEYLLKNKEEINEKRRTKRLENTTLNKEKDREYYNKNKKEISERRKNNYPKNRKQILKRGQDYRQKNKEHLQQYGKKVVDSLPDFYIIKLIKNNGKNSIEKEDLPRGFIEFYRANLLLKRTVKQLKEKENEQSKSEQSHEL